jgi:hypothetical protein
VACHATYVQFTVRYSSRIKTATVLSKKKKSVVKRASNDSIATKYLCESNRLAEKLTA